MVESNLQICAACRFAVSHPDAPESHVFCTRLPPTPFLLNVKRDEAGRIVGTEQINLNPVLGLAGTCGEWSPKPEDLQ